MKTSSVLPAEREACICTMLRTLARKTTGIYDSYLNETGLKLPQYSLLSRLDRLGSCSLTELAEAMELDITSTSRNVGVLARAGLIDAAEGRDGRTKSYRLSRKGRASLKRAYAAWQRSQQAVRQLLSAQHLGSIAQAASAVASHSPRSA